MARLSDNRKRTMANHSATHLMHEALRRVLGPHVTQKGQMVDGERIRFDISHGAAITREELAKVEDEVNQVIMQNAEADTKLMSPDAAIEAGAMALFGEKYGDEVRVLSLGKPIDDTPKDYSVELCGGLLKNASSKKTSPKPKSSLRWAAQGAAQARKTSAA